MIDIRTLSLAEIEAFVISKGDKAYRSKQVFEWLWKKGIVSFDQMNNIPATIINALKENYSLPSLQIKSSQKSNDNTIKIGFELHDKLLIESVLIPSGNRVTACISSQVGCVLKCKFCATGRLKAIRNLEPTEIFDQVIKLMQLSIDEYGIKLTNIVVMGMGEPLLNYNHVLLVLNMLISPKGQSMSHNRITLSTAGLIKEIKALADEKVKFNLAISLHCADDLKRSILMPVNKSNPLAELQDAIRYFHEKTHDRITIEYLLLKDFNDSLVDAQKLAEFCKAFPTKINLIEYNHVEGSGYEPSDAETINAFAEFLIQKNMVVNTRYSRGKDIDAACGQLANKLDR